MMKRLLITGHLVEATAEEGKTGCPAVRAKAEVSTGREAGQQGAAGDRCSPGPSAALSVARRWIRDVHSRHGEAGRQCPP
jgi:hypothetical protein